MFTKEISYIDELVSVVVPTYNSEHTIKRTLDSILNQTYENLEILVVDDNSSDKTLDILESYKKQDERIKIYTKKSNKGVANSRNIAIKNSRGRYIAFLDSDDQWSSKKIETQISHMKKNNWKFTYSGYYETLNGEVYGRKSAPESVSYRREKYGNVIGCLTVVYDQSFCGMIQIPELKKRNDYALWLKALKVCGTAFYIPEYLAIYHKTSNSLSSGSKIKLLKYHYILFRESQKYGVLKSVYYTFFNTINYVLTRNKHFKKSEFNLADF